jgi:hypothetical protein
MERSKILDKIKNNKNTNSDLEEQINELNLCLIKAKEAVESELNKTNMQNMGFYTKRNEFWCDELERLKQRRRHLHEEFMKTKSEYYRLALKATRTEFKQVIRNCKKEAKNKAAKRLVQKFSTSSISFWREIKTKTEKAPKVNISHQKLTEYYMKTLNERNPTSTINEEKIDRDLKENITKAQSTVGKIKIEVTEIFEILKSLKNNKAVGKQGISNEMFKYARKTFLSNFLSTLITKLINYSLMPACMNIGVLITILKNNSGDNTDIDNTRPITISDTISTVFEKYILKRLKRMKTNESQFGFKKNSSTQHPIFLLRESMRILKQEKKSAYVFFVDFSKAFDKINRQKMFHKLIPDLEVHTWYAVKLYYDISVVYVYDKEEGYSKSIIVTIGVKQGGSLSPILFIKYVDRMIELVKESRLVWSYHGLILGMNGYADDMKAICLETWQAKRMLKIIEQYCQNNDIKINSKKTEWLKTGEKYSKVLIKPNRYENFKLNGEKLAKVAKYKYLGMWITSNGTNKVHLNKRKCIALSAIAPLKNIGFENRYLTPKLKGILFQTFIRSKLSYAMENCRLTVGDTQMMSTFENNIVKNSYNLSTHSYTTPILQAMEMSTFDEYLQCRRVSFLSQLLRNSATRNYLLINGQNKEIERTLQIIEYNEPLTPFFIRSQGTINTAINIIVKCNEYLNRTKSKSRVQKETKLTKAVRYLLNDPTDNNLDTLGYLVHAKNRLKDYI